MTQGGRGWPQAHHLVRAARGRSPHLSASPPSIRPQQIYVRVTSRAGYADSSIVVVVAVFVRSEFDGFSTSE